ncbi:MAG: hypothetical protein C0625_08275 [Arcobacter sp.]|nr:MAG: hypothetical protein C0625_08275 [Arcobacter sp.]
MGNEYQIVEDGVIQCACGGKVILTSTVKEQVIGGKKPLYWEDLLGAPISGCPYPFFPCTEVASISPIETEMNVGASGKPYLLRADGATTDKGRALVLVDPGQHTSKISAPPSISPEDIVEEEPTPVAIKEEEKIKHKQKYALYFLRKSEDIYKPLRPTRTFRKTDEKFLSKDDTVDIKDNVHVHTFAYIYITQNKQINEYKVISKGTLYTEELKDILFENTKTKIKYDYIPIEKDSNIEISYSSIKLADEDVPKLKRLSVNPKEPDKEDCFYFKDADGINKNKLTKKDIETQKEFKQDKEGKQKRLNILCIIDDVLAEIEDMYNRYYTNYKLALAQNHSIIENIRKKNEYSYSIANTLNHFYVDANEQKEYDENTKILKKDYEDLVEILFSNKLLVEEILKDNNLATLIEKGSSVPLSYLQETIYVKKDFFKKIVLKNVNQNMFEVNSNAYATEHFKKNYPYSRGRARGYLPNIKNFFDFLPKNTKLNIYQNRPEDVLALVIFSILFSLKFEDVLKQCGDYDKIHRLRKEFYFTLKNTKPMPQIGENNIRDTKSLLEKQKPYNAIFSKKDKLLSEYELLEHNKKLNSFNYSTKSIKFDSLYYDKGLKYYKVEGIESPEKTISKIATKLKEDKKLEKLLGIYQGLTNIDKKDYVISAMNIIYLLHAPRTHLDEETNLTTPFNSEYKKLLEFMSDLTTKRKALSQEDKKFIEDNYGIHDVYNTMQYNLIAHAYLAQKQKRKDIVETFLKQFPAQKVKYEIVLPNLLDNNFDEEFKAKAKIEELYETLKGIDGSSSRVGDALDEKNKSLKTRGTAESSGVNKFSNNLNTHIKSLSFLVAGANIARILSGKEKLTAPSTIGLANDISLLTNSITNTVEKNIELVKTKDAKTLVQKVFSKENVNITKNASGKIIAFLAIPTIIISTGFEIEKYAKDEDYDAAFFVTLKSALTLTLLLAVPFTIGAFLLLAVIELAWYLLSHKLIDSKLERYIKKSLFFRDIPILEISYKNKSIWGKSFKSEILLETISKDKELKALNDEGFSNIKEIKNFIGDNYNKHKEILEASLKNELNQITIALLGYKIEHLDKNIKKPLYTLKNGYKPRGNFNTVVKIDKGLIEGTNYILLVSKNGKYEQVSTTPYEDDYIYDFTKSQYDDYNWQNKGTSEVERLASSDCYIILSNDHAQIKYRVEFKKEYSSEGFSPIIDLKIDELEEKLLNDEDYKQIKK